jgi:hypothetical protein
MRIMLMIFLMTLSTHASANYYVCNPESFGDGTKKSESLRLEVISNAIMINGSKYNKLNGFSDKPRVHVFNKDIWSDFDIQLAIVDTSNNGANNGAWPRVKKFSLRFFYHYGPDQRHHYTAYTVCKSF